MKKAIIGVLAALTLGACQEKDVYEHFQAGFGEVTTAKYVTDTLLAETHLSDLTLDEVTRIALPQQQLSYVRLFAANSTSAFQFDYCSCSENYIFATEPVTLTDVQKFASALNIQFNSKDMETFAAQKSSLQFCYSSKQKSIINHVHLLETAGYTVDIDMYYDSLPGVVFTDARMPLEKIVD